MNKVSLINNVILKKINFVFILLICFFSVSFAVDKTVYITSESEYYNLAQSTYVLIDSSNQLTIDQVMCENCPLVFKRNQQNELYNPHTNVTYWYKIQIENKFQMGKSMVLEFANSTIPIIQVYVKRKSNLYEYRTTGNSLPFKTRDLDNAHFCFQLTLEANEKLTVYAQILPQGDALNTPIALYDAMSFTNQSNREGLLNGIYYGIMFLTIIISLIISLSFSTISEKSNYIFLGILFFFTMWNADLDGLAFQYLWSTNPWLSKFFMYILPLIGIIFMSLFSYNNSKQFLSILLFNIKLVISLIIVLFILYTFVFNIPLAYIHAISLLLGTCMLTLTCYSWYIEIKLEPHFAKYFIALLLSILAWLIIITLKTFTNFLPNDFYTYSFKIFLGIQAGILTLLVISKMQGNYSELYYGKMINLNKEVADKTEEINNKKKELTSINKDITLINNLLKKQNKELIQKDEQLILGTNYTKNIQQYLIPNITPNTKISKQIFTFFKPKNELCSDVFYVKQIEDILFVAVFDCSVNGIPGTLMSIMVYNFLNNIIADKNIFETDKILLILQRNILEMFTANNNNFFSTDSVDIGVVSIDLKTNILNYSGTKIPAWIINSKGFIEFRGDSNSLNENKSKREYHFTSYSQKLQYGDMVYLFSNGYTNQFNSKNEKFMKRNLKLLLSQIHSHPLNIQRHDIEKCFLEWKGNEDQTDDVLILGIKI